MPYITGDLRVKYQDKIDLILTKYNRLVSNDGYKKQDALFTVLSNFIKIEYKETFQYHDTIGILNYIVSSVLNSAYEQNRYCHLNSIIGIIEQLKISICRYPMLGSDSTLIGVLECIKLEMYRRRVGPYEDLTIVKNGDINYPFISNS